METAKCDKKWKTRSQFCIFMVRFLLGQNHYRSFRINMMFERKLVFILQISQMNNWYIRLYGDKYPCFRVNWLFFIARSGIFTHVTDSELRCKKWNRIWFSSNETVSANTSDPLDIAIQFRNKLKFE